MLIAMRWSRCVSTARVRGAAQRFAAGAVDDQPVGASPRPARPRRSSAAAIAARRSLSLTRSSSSPRVTVRPCASAAATNSTGNSSIMLGASAGSTSIPVSAEWRTRRSATGSPPTSRGSSSSMLAAHLAQHVEQPGAGGVEADVLDHEVAARARSARRRRRRRPTRDRPAPRSPAGAARPRRAGGSCGPRRSSSTSSSAPNPREHPLGVVARRHRLDHRGDARRVEPGEQHRALHLRRGDRQAVGDRHRRASAPRTVSGSVPPGAAVELARPSG